MDSRIILLQLLTAFTGAFGYAMLFRIEKGKLIQASLGGLLSWACYLACGLVMTGEVKKYFIASVIITIYAEMMARREKTPATVFLVPGTIPLIPGGFLYQTMSYALAEEWSSFFTTGLLTILLAVAISGGILTTMTGMKIYQRTAGKYQRNTGKL